MFKLFFSLFESGTVYPGSSGQPWGKTFKFYPLDILDYPGFLWMLRICWIYFTNAY